jgi:hypothetical protein
VHQLIEPPPVYLKLRGVEPDDHEVTKELVRLHIPVTKLADGMQDRIKTYYAKIRSVEEPESSVSIRNLLWQSLHAPERSSSVDKVAAKRFISAAIPKSQRVRSSIAMPSTSAAALAAQQARQVDEEEDRQVGMSRRMRFISKDVEKIGEGMEEVLGVIGGEEEENHQDDDVWDEEDDDEEDEEEVEEEMAEERENAEVGVEDLLKEVEGEINTQREARSREEQGGNLVDDPVSMMSIKSKRKRAEDLS